MSSRFLVQERRSMPGVTEAFMDPELAQLAKAGPCEPCNGADHFGAQRQLETQHGCIMMPGRTRVEFVKMVFKNFDLVRGQVVPRADCW